jgi:hypothetical protein
MGDAVHFRAMNLYKFFTVNERDAVVAERFIHCADDADARAIGATFVTEAHGIEVWDVGRRILKLRSAGAGDARER